MKSLKGFIIESCQQIFLWLRNWRAIVVYMTLARWSLDAAKCWGQSSFSLLWKNIDDNCVRIHILKMPSPWNTNSSFTVLFVVCFLICEAGLGDGLFLQPHPLAFALVDTLAHFPTSSFWTKNLMYILEKMSVKISLFWSNF